MFKKNINICMAASLLALTSCMRHSDNIDVTNAPVPYTVGGYDTSDAVAAANLVTKLSFENNLTDSKGGLSSGTGTAANYSAGIKGMGWQGSSTQQRYAVFNAGSAINSVGTAGFTYTFWIKTAGTVANPSSSPVQGSGAQGILELVDPTGFWGNTDIFLQNPDASNPSRIQISMHVQNKRSGVAWGDQWPLIKVDGQQNKWFQVALTYDAVSGKFSAYINGAPAANVQGPYSPASGFTGGYTWYAKDPLDLSNSGNAPVYGPIQYDGTVSQVLLGSFQFQTNPSLNGGGPQSWATDFAGNLDEVRIYNAPLSAGQVSSLFILESSGK